MIYLFLYLAVGIGFSLSAWLEASTSAVEEKRERPKYFSQTGILFTALWPLVAIYCYRVYVSRTMPPIDYFK